MVTDSVCVSREVVRKSLFLTWTPKSFFNGDKGEMGLDVLTSNTESSCIAFRSSASQSMGDDSLLGDSFRVLRLFGGVGAILASNGGRYWMGA